MEWLCEATRELIQQAVNHGGMAMCEATREPFSKWNGYVWSHQGADSASCKPWWNGYVWSHQGADSASCKPCYVWSHQGADSASCKPWWNGYVWTHGKLEPRWAGYVQNLQWVDNHNQSIYCIAQYKPVPLYEQGLNYNYCSLKLWAVSVSCNIVIVINKVS